MSVTRYTRVLLKLSGESLGGGESPFDAAHLQGLATAIAPAVRDGLRLGIVVGGGNLFRARSADLRVIDRVTADHVGMLATIMNGAVLRDYLRNEGLRAQVLTPRETPPLGRRFTRDLALELLKQGTVLVFAGGTGNPYFTTDSAAALRALEIGADVLLKATQVDGVYDRDPHRHPDAVRFDSLTYDEAIDRRLGVMDLTALALCAQRGLPTFVFDVSDPANLARALRGDGTGTWVTKEPLT